MTERVVDAAVRDMLILNQPFDYCHLIKFERPSLPDSYTGKISTSKERYTYITDSSIDVNFDDGSYSLAGVANGTQTYWANKVLKVSPIMEEVEAKASTFTLNLDGTAIGATVSATVAISVVAVGIYDLTFPDTVDLIDLGFREGDKITLTGNTAPGDYNIEAFRGMNVLRLKKIDTTLTVTNNRTNLILQSQTFQTTWTKGNTGVTANTAVAPDGSLTADKVFTTFGVGASGERYVRQTRAITAGTITGSIYVKAAGKTSFRIRCLDNAAPANGFLGSVDTSTGLTSGSGAGTGTFTSVSAIDVGNDWWRLSVTGTASSSTNVIFDVFILAGNQNSGTTFIGDDTTGGYFWGAQLQTGAAATTYIPTTTATAGVEESLISMSLSSEEIKSVLIDKNSLTYSSFINREVFIYKALFQDGAIVGSPILLFKGLISSMGFDDNDANIKISWGLTSHWGDWQQVAGRITSDDFHRALDDNGNPNPLSSLKPLYAYDKGFTHAETSINTLAHYTVMVEKQDVSVKKKWFGLSTSVKVKKYLAPEDRTTQLDLQLQAKSIPIIYGVRPVSGIPIFADTLNTDSSTVYVAYALSEGEIGGIYDVYIDGNSLICNSKADFDARSTQTADETVPLVCMGRADRGDVLGGASALTGGSTSFYGTAANPSTLLDIGYNLGNFLKYYNYTAPIATAPVATAVGLKDGETLTLTSPQAITLDFFSGKPAQKAASSLTTIAASVPVTNGFKIQNSYWSGTDTAEYWGPNHRLLDTAYVVGKFKIAEGETTIPDLNFIVNGKVIPSYNYDYSYSQWVKATGELSSNFLLGDIVDLYRSDTNAVINSGVQIIDKWIFYNPDGTANTRFRFGLASTGEAIAPSLNYAAGVPSITKFYMKSGLNTWTMVTYNNNETSGTISVELSSPLTTTVTNTGNYVQFNFTSSSNLNVGGDPLDVSPKFSILTTGNTAIINERFGSAIFSGTDTATSLVTPYLYSTNSAYATAAALTSNKIIGRNTIKLANTANATNDYYNGYSIVLTRNISATGKQIVQTKNIIAYNGANKIATIDGVWDSTCIPTSGDLYYIVQPYVDHRVSTNFSIQALDYVTSTTYGRGLSINNDLDFASWLEAARDCDARSDVTIRLTASTVAPTAGAIYKLTNTAGKIIWQGTVSTAYTSTIPGTNTTYVAFTNVIGKLTNQWNSWRTFNEGEYVYWLNNLYKVAAAGTVGTTAPVHVTGTVNNLIYQSGFNIAGTAGSITKVSGTGDANLYAYYSGNPVQAIRLNRIASGYSLYDSDGIDYWRYIGWDAQDQRFVTRHQGNLIIDTSQPVFDNINSMLNHFGGILRYSSGKYYLEVETLAPTISTFDVLSSTGTTTSVDPYNITEDHIIGKIALTDEGIRSAYNSLAVSYADPANKFEARNISFFNSTYLTTDRNVPKKGNLTIPGVTNYYNARLLADRYLNKSRFGLSISITISPRGMLLVPGQIIQLQYARYGWTNKKFRIDSLTIHDECLVDITAREYDSSIYDGNSVTRQSGVGSGPAPVPITNLTNGPTNLTATTSYSGVTTKATVSLTWTQSSTGNAANTISELYSINPDNTIVTISSNTCTTTSSHGYVVGDLISVFTTANGLTAAAAYYINAITTNTFTLVDAFTAALSKDSAGVVSVTGTSPTLVNGTALTISVGKQVLLTSLNYPSAQYADVINTTTAITKFYRIRNKVTTTSSNGITNNQYSDYNPTLDITAIIGTTVPNSKIIIGYLTNEAATFQATNAGVVTDFTPGNGVFKMSADEVDVSTGAGTTYNLVSNVDCTATIDAATGIYSVSAMSADSGAAVFSATYSGTTITKTLSLAKSKAGGAGASGISVYVATIYQQAASTPATPVATASTYNFSTNTLTPPAGWSATQPATTTTPTYACDYTFSGAPGATVTGTGSWSAPYIEAVNGTPGAPGAAGEYRDIIELYLISATAPTKPTSVPYTFTGNVVGTVTGGTAGWTATRPATTTTPMYITKCLATSTTPTVAVTLTAWSTPVIIGQLATDAITINMTNQSMGVFAYADGSIPSFTTVNGTLTIYSGNTDVTAGATLSSTGVNCTGTINNALNTPVTGAKGYYAISAMSADLAQLTITVVYNSITYTRLFSLAKVKTGYEIVATLPTTSNFVGRMVFLTTDNKLYRYDGTAFTAAVAATDLTGTLTDAQLTAISAAKITGSIVGTQITDGAISTAKIAANAITSNEIAAGTIVAGDIAALTITGTEIAAGAITANKIAVNTITANEIAAGAITAAKVAATSVITLTAQIDDAIITSAKITSLAAGKITAGNITVGVNVGSTGKIIMDGANNRILITD